MLFQLVQKDKAHEELKSLLRRNPELKVGVISERRDRPRAFVAMFSEEEVQQLRAKMDPADKDDLSGFVDKVNKLFRRYAD